MLALAQNDHACMRCVNLVCQLGGVVRRPASVLCFRETPAFHVSSNDKYQPSY